MKKYTWKEKECDEWVNYISDTVEECIEDARYEGVEGVIHIVEVEQELNHYKINEETIQEIEI